METNTKPPNLLGNKTNLLLFLPLEKKEANKLFSVCFIKKLILVFLLISASTLTAENFLFYSTKQKNESFQEQTFDQEKLIISSGNSLLPVSSLPNSDSKIVKKIPVIVTAYSSTPWETWGDPFITASGSWVRDGIIANNLLPFGTKVRMPEIYGDKVFVVEDRMNSRKGNYHFDVWFPSYHQALEFGAKKTYVEVLEG